MTFAEKKLYHQIHPLKLGTDIVTSLFTLYLFWLHYFWLPLLLHFLLPILGSFFVIKFCSLENQKKSPLGRYIKKYMTGFVEAVRLVGDFITVFGAWYHNWFLLLAGMIVILLGWYNGKIRSISFLFL